MTTINLSAPLPDSLSELIDYYHDVRDLRLAMEKEVAPVQEHEKKAKERIQQLLFDAGLTGASGERYRAQRVEKRVPSVKDWQALHAWVQASGRFDVLQKRILNSAVLDMWETDQDVPGVEPAVVVDLSVTKV